MFGLDARVTVIIAAALVAIAGSMLITAVQSIQLTKLQTYVNQTIQVLEARLHDCGSITLSTFEDLTSQPTNCAKTAVLQRGDDDHTTNGYLQMGRYHLHPGPSLLQDADFTGSGGTACTPTSDCWQYLFLYANATPTSFPCTDRILQAYQASIDGDNEGATPNYTGRVRCYSDIWAVQGVRVR